MENNSRPIDDGAAILGASQASEQSWSVKMGARPSFQGLVVRRCWRNDRSPPIGEGDGSWPRREASGSPQKIPNFFLKAEKYRPIYRLGGNYGHEGCKKQIKVSPKSAVN
jgi:hypothetical protein